jgi:hypothetical protein
MGVVAYSHWCDHVPDVLAAEALAARDGVLLARSSGCERIVLELDDKELVNLLSSSAGERSSIAGLWHEIFELSKDFTSFIISFVNLDGNEAAHVCVKPSSVINRECVWLENFPVVLVGRVEDDCNPTME